MKRLFDLLDGEDSLATRWHWPSLTPKGERLPSHPPMSDRALDRQPIKENDMKLVASGKSLYEFEDFRFTKQYGVNFVDLQLRHQVEALFFFLGRTRDDYALEKRFHRFYLATFFRVPAGYKVTDAMKKALPELKEQKRRGLRNDALLCNAMGLFSRERGGFETGVEGESPKENCLFFTSAQKRRYLIASGGVLDPTDLKKPTRDVPFRRGEEHL